MAIFEGTSKVPITIFVYSSSLLINFKEANVPTQLQAIDVNNLNDDNGTLSPLFENFIVCCDGAMDLIKGHYGTVVAMFNKHGSFVSGLFMRYFGYVNVELVEAVAARDAALFFNSLFFRIISWLEIQDL
ncbi:hypothetical protein ACH5RR_023634 [Cinchona calisaya]|uniref:RNase H type-1 domain-containing protein n=1 Tax=Cinchona calisaya TaxID=153742 RepID=A0ABD2ZB68_9GENT